ncbi:MAG: FxsA family protein [Pseudomonadota bacterium]
MRWILLLLPWAELYGLIQLGGHIGGFATLVYVFLTLLLGMSIVRAQGLEIVARLREAQENGGLTGRLLADDLAVGLGGVLMAIPGLITDLLAVAVLLGPLWRRLTGQTRAASPSTAYNSQQNTQRNTQRGPTDPHRSSTGQARRHDTIEGEFRRIDDDPS